jgi:hypothetical protein
MSDNKDLQDKLIEIEKYILDPNRNPDLVAEKIRQDKLSKRRRAYRLKKLQNQEKNDKTKENINLEKKEEKIKSKKKSQKKSKKKSQKKIE